MSYKLVVICLLLTVYVSCLAFGINSQLPCTGFYGNCLTGENKCCGGMSCQESTTGSWNCFFDLTSTPDQSNTNKRFGINKLIQDSALLNLIEATQPHFPCISKGGNCAATPMACCDDMTCEQDVYSQWFCVASN